MVNKDERINTEATLIAKMKRVSKLYNTLVFRRNLLQSKTYN